MSTIYTPKDIAVNVICQKITDKKCKPLQLADERKTITVNGFTADVFVKFVKKWTKIYDNMFRKELKMINININHRWIEEECRKKIKHIVLPEVVKVLLGNYSSSEPLINKDYFQRYYPRSS